MNSHTRLLRWIALLALPLAVASCSNQDQGRSTTQNVGGQSAATESGQAVLAAAAQAADRGERLPSRFTQYLPPQDALVRRLTTIETESRYARPMYHAWSGKVPAGVGDEIWAWQQQSGDHVFQGEALVRGRRVIDGYVLRVLPANQAE
jgi:hypothetical protein